MLQACNEGTQRMGELHQTLSRLLENLDLALIYRGRHWKLSNCTGLKNLYIKRAAGPS